MDAIEALQQRVSSPRLVEPAPNDAELREIYKAALRAPDHGMLRPWRFLTVRGEARERLGQLYLDCSEPEDDAKRDKLLNAPLRAPLVIVVAASLTHDHPKVPPVEQICAAAAAAQNISVAAYAMGYASIWRTGPVAFNPKIKEGLGLKPDDEIVGYLYIGTATVERPVPELEVDDFVKEWTEPGGKG